MFSTPGSSRTYKEGFGDYTTWLTRKYSKTFNKTIVFKYKSEGNTHSLFMNNKLIGKRIGDNSFDAFLYHLKSAFERKQYLNI